MERESRYLVGFIAAPITPSLLASIYFQSLSLLGFGLFAGYLIYLFAWPLFILLISKKLTSLLSILITACLLAVIPYSLFAYIDGQDFTSILTGSALFGFFGLTAGITFCLITKSNFKNLGIEETLK